jgi:hypothetical protein
VAAQAQDMADAVHRYAGTAALVSRGTGVPGIPPARVFCIA